MSGNMSNLQRSISEAQGNIDKQNTMIQRKSLQLDEKQKQVYGQAQELEDKMKLLETRNKMLQLSIDRNVYKKKVIYSLLSIILLMIIGILCFYAFFNKVKNVV